MMRAVVLFALASLAATTQAQPTGIAVHADPLSCMMHDIFEIYKVIQDPTSSDNTKAAVQHLIADVRSCSNAAERKQCIVQAILDDYAASTDLQPEMYALFEKINNVFLSCQGSASRTRSLHDLLVMKSVALPSSIAARSNPPSCYWHIMTESYKFITEAYKMFYDPTSSEAAKAVLKHLIADVKSCLRSADRNQCIAQAVLDDYEANKDLQPEMYALFESLSNILTSCEMSA